MTQFALEDVIAESNKPKYDRIVKCKFCDEPGLMFDTSKTGNPWLYSVTELLSKEQVAELATNPRYSKNLREVALGRDQEGNLATGFVLILKHKPHPACRLETQLALEAQSKVGETGTIDVAVADDGKTPVHPEDAVKDDYDGTEESETADEEYGLLEYAMVDDDDDPALD